VMEQSSWSMMVSFMATSHLASQSFEGAELKLFDGAFAASEFLRNFTDAALIKEAALQDAALVVRQPIEQLREQRLLLGFIVCRGQF